jgi:hypothetical protein
MSTWQASRHFSGETGIFEDCGIDPTDGGPDRISADPPDLPKNSRGRYVPEQRAVAALALTRREFVAKLTISP